MTDREIEKTYRKIIEAEAPDLWNRIDSQLEAKEAKPVKQSIWERIRKVLFGGGVLRTAVTVCVLCIIVIGVAGQAGGLVGIRMSAASSDRAAAGEANGTGSATQYSMAMADEAAEAEMAEAGSIPAEGAATTEAAAVSGADGWTKETGADEETDGQTTQRKLIRDIYLDVETLDFDNLISSLQSQTEELDGYVEYSNINGNSYYYDRVRYAELTLRIPKDKTDGFLNQVGEAANITSKSENVQDVTLTYVDLESHVKALRTEEEQLMEILDQAETVEDIMSIQSRLSEVRYQLESYMSQLKTYDNQVDYDTVTIYIREVTRETPTEELSIWQQMQNGFADSIAAIGVSIQNLCIWLVAKIPYFVILFVVVLTITAIVKKRKKK